MASITWSGGGEGLIYINLTSKVLIYTIHRIRGMKNTNPWSNTIPWASVCPCIIREIDNIWNSLKRKELSSHLGMQSLRTISRKAPPTTLWFTIQPINWEVSLLKCLWKIFFSPLLLNFNLTAVLLRSFLDRIIYQLPVTLAPESYSRTKKGDTFTTASLTSKFQFIHHLI